MTEQPPPQTDIKFDNMSRQDLKKIQKSMKRPQFMGLLNEYMIEISDPKNKNEYDQYLRQMERQKQLPKHMKIVEIKPKFCFRTFVVSQKNKKHEMKFFINMCESQYLQKPSCEPAPGEDGKVGYSWKIPNSSGKIRYDQDKKGSPCQVIDVAFHPDTYFFAVRKQFQQMMINIALQAAQKQLVQRKESLSRDYVILKNVICKGVDGKPALMPIRYIEGKVYNKGQGPSTEPERDNEGRQTKLQKEINKQKEEHDKAKKAKKEEDKEQTEQIQDVQENKLVVDLSEGVQRPKYSTIFTYPVDYSQFIDNPAMNNRRKVPSAFNIEFAIPRVQSIAEIADQKLQINDKKILLKIGEKYFIDLQLEQFKLKYVIQTSMAKAKYDKKKKSLRIVIPVDQSINYHPEQANNLNSQLQQSKEKQEEKANVVESQVWKNKVLDFTEPSVSVKMLNTQQAVEEKPKLVQEIDQQDEVTPAPKAQAPKQQEQQQGQEIKKKSQKFSLSQYYKKTQHDSIKYVYQQTTDKILLVFQMKNYKKQQIFTIIHQNKEFLLEWREGGKQGKFSHLKLKDEFSQKASKVEVVQRIGFIAFTITKLQKGKYWEKTSIEEVPYPQPTDQERYAQFKETYNRISQLQSEIAIVQKQSIPTLPQNKENVQSQVNSQVKSVQKKEDAPIQQSTQIEARAQPARNKNMFNNLQVQFIIFNAPFIEALD